ncbi:MAG: FecR family protein [Janthinobacterium lividum]
MIDPMEEAIAWHLRQRDMAEDGWEAFVAWLEASPANAAAYDVVASDDAVLAQALASVPVAVATPAPRSLMAHAPNAPRRRWARIAGAGAIAATLAIVLLPLAGRGGARPYAIETRPGELRTLALADGTEVQLGGGSRLRLDHADPRVAVLDRGEALMRVRHDAAHPFTLRSGGVVIRDMGTVFDVTRAGTRLTVAVAEGSVVFQPAADAVTLTAGHRLAFDEDRARVTLGRVAPGDVGSWRQDRLAFTDEPLSAVADAIERRYGTRIVLAAGLSDRPFTGMIGLTGSVERDVPHLAALIGADWRHDRGQWTLAVARTAPEGGRLL